VVGGGDSLLTECLSASLEELCSMELGYWNIYFDHILFCSFSIRCTSNLNLRCAPSAGKDSKKCIVESVDFKVPKLVHAFEYIPLTFQPAYVSVISNCLSDGRV
jgi:hypothetical protein